MEGPDCYKPVRPATRSADLGAKRTEYLLSQLSLDSKKHGRTGAHHPFIKKERGGSDDTLDPFQCVDSRPSTANSASNTRISNMSGLSESSASSAGSGIVSGGSVKRHLVNLYKHTTGHDPDERVMADINACAQIDSERGNVCNETRYVEKLKIHLIHQGREKDAKRVVELHQKLKGMSVLKNREAVIGLLYGLFDKEATRAKMAASRKHPLSLANNIQQGSQLNTQEDNGSDFIGESFKRPEDVFSEKAAVESSSGNLQTRKLKKNVPSTYKSNDIDYTPIPRLHSLSDKMLNHDLVGDTKVPSLRPSKFEGKKLDMEKECNWDKSSNSESVQRGNAQPTWQSISTISRAGEDFPRIVNTGLEAIGGFSRQIVTSTPIDTSSMDRQRHYVNSRKARENNSVTSRGHTSLKVVPANNGQAFGNAKSMERDLIRDIVFILQGISGNFIKSTPKGTFEIVTKHFVHPTLRLHTMKLCELGFCYTKIRNYCDKPTNGLMAQGFKQAIEKELKEYYRLLAVIQEQIQQTLVDTPISEDLPKKVGEMTMLKLTIWLFECRPRLQVLSGMVESCQSKSGGELCSVIYNYSQHGDPLVRELTVSLLSTICKPLYIMLSQWILYGELEDPFGEFFIAANPTCKREQLWHLKYRIRPQMLPSFISMEQAGKILAIGKNINFLKEICNNADEFQGRCEIKALLETGEVESLFWGENSPIKYAIEMSYKTTSEKVLKVLIDDSNLLDHLKAIKKYLLLGQGDFIQYFLELIQDELSKSASKLYNHNISAILESAVRATNAQFETEDILSRLDTRILPTSDKDFGWDVFCLDYKAHGPIGTVLTENVMNGYNKLFNSLWRTKRIEIILSTLWKNQTVLFKYLRLIPELAPVLHRSQLLISEMIHFVHQTQYYIMFEATECAWEKLMDDVNKASDLDEVIKSHQKFLDTIFKRSLLDAESRDLLNQLRGIFDSVHELRTFLKEFNERVEVEVQSRKDLQPNTEEVRCRQRQFFASYVMQAKGKIETLYTTTQDLVRTFLLVLNRQQDLTLQCLSFRLDFNEYYHQKDSRLSQPLTFQHRRLSSNAFTPLNMSGSFAGMNSSPLVASMSIPELSED